MNLVENFAEFGVKTVIPETKVDKIINTREDRKEKGNHFQIVFKKRENLITVKFKNFRAKNPKLLTQS